MSLFKTGLNAELYIHFVSSIVTGNLFSAIWDTSHWNFFVKFGYKTPYDISGTCFGQF